MAIVRMSEAEVARDLHAVLARVQQGVEILVEQDHGPVAVIRAQDNRSGRPIAAILREARERNSGVTLDADFGRDLEEIIESHQHPWNPSFWDSL